jgi:hypothetical protein
MFRHLWDPDALRRGSAEAPGRGKMDLLLCFVANPCAIKYSPNITLMTPGFLSDIFRHGGVSVFQRLQRLSLCACRGAQKGVHMLA